MSSKEIRPSSIDGIKRLAKSIKVAQGIQHTEALDVAARAAGYQNYRHASNFLSKVNSDSRIVLGIVCSSRPLGKTEKMVAKVVKY